MDAKPKPLLPWQGGKSRLLKFILKLIPSHKCYVEPFCGGTAVFLAKMPTRVEVINDINNDIYNLYRIVKYHYVALEKEFSWLLVSRQHFETLKNMPNETLTDIQKATKFLYMQKLCFAGVAGTNKHYGYSTTRRLAINHATLGELLKAVHQRLQNVNIEHRDWFKVVSAYDRSHTFFYCDPPYYKVRKYSDEFNWAQYEKLADFTKTMKGKILISLNDRPEIRKLFSHLDITATTIQYSMSTKGVRNQTGELLIKNY